MVVLALTLAEITVILIALDVANLAGNPACSLPINYAPVDVITTGRPTFQPSPETFTLAPDGTGSFPPSTVPTQLPSFSPSARPTVRPTFRPVSEPPTNEGDTFSPTLSTNSPFTAAPFTFTPTSQRVAINASELTPPCGGIATAQMWEAIFYVILAFVALLIPFMIFFYEAFDVDRKFGDKVCEAVQNQGLAVVVAGVVLGVMYSQLNTFSYPVNAFPVQVENALTCSAQFQDECIVTRGEVFFNPNSSFLVATAPPSSATTSKMLINNVPISFGIYLGSFMSFFSWFLFAIYTGVGLITFPLELIARFRFRPRYIPKDVYIKLREDIRQRVDTLITLAEKMKKERRDLDDNYSRLGYRERYNKRNAQRSWFLQFKKEVLQCETEFEDIYMCHENWTSFNPLIPFFMLFLGVISVCLSLAWLLHIVLFMIPQTWPEATVVPTYFLNEVMTWGLIYSGFALLGVVFLAIFGLYLFACNLSGNFKIGLRFLLFDIHPMKMGATYMSSFLVNVLLLLLQAPALVNFMSTAFSNTIVLTDVDLIMNWTVRYTTFFVYFFENSVFLFMLLAVMALTFIAWVMLPDERKENQRKLKKRIEKMQARVDNRERKAKMKKFEPKPDNEQEEQVAGT